MLLTYKKENIIQKQRKNYQLFFIRIYEIQYNRPYADLCMLSCSSTYSNYYHSFSFSISMLWRCTGGPRDNADILMVFVCLPQKINNTKTQIGQENKQNKIRVFISLEPWNFEWATNLKMVIGKYYKQCKHATDGRTDGLSDRQIDSKTDGRTDKCRNSYIKHKEKVNSDKQE